MSKKISERLAAFLVFLFLASAAVAHVPMMEGPDTHSFKDALKIPRPETSYAVYSNLDRPGDIDFYSFEVKKPMKAHVSLIVPYRPEYLDFYPVYAVVGPGLPAPQSKVPFDLEKGYGAVVFSGMPSAERPVFYEAFSRVNYYEGIPKFDQELREPGIYYIVVWRPSGETGAYILGYGLAEKFTAKDWSNTFKLLGSIRSGAWETKRGKPPAGCPCMKMMDGGSDKPGAGCPRMQETPGDSQAPCPGMKMMQGNTGQSPCASCPHMKMMKDDPANQGCPCMGMMQGSTANPGAACPKMKQMQGGQAPETCPMMKMQGGSTAPEPQAEHKH